jgi:hypothetical protein
MFVEERNEIDGNLMKNKPCRVLPVVVFEFSVISLLALRGSRFDVSR